MSHHVEQDARGVGREDAPFHPDQIDRMRPLTGHVGQIQRGGPPGAALAGAHRPDQGGGLHDLAIAGAEDQPGIGQQELAGSGREAPLREIPGDHRAGPQVSANIPSGDVPGFRAQRVARRRVAGCRRTRRRRGHGRQQATGQNQTQGGQRQRCATVLGAAVGASVALAGLTQVVSIRIAVSSTMSRTIVPRMAAAARGGTGARAWVGRAAVLGSGAKVLDLGLG